MSWKNRLYQSLRGKPLPVFIFGESIISGANLWSGARVWIGELRKIGLKPGDRVMVSMEPCQNFLWVLIASLCEEYTLALLPPGVSAEEFDTARELVDPAVTIVTDLAGSANHVSLKGDPGESQGILFVNPLEIPDFNEFSVRKTRIDRQPDIRLLLRTSGSTGKPRLIALTDRNLFSVIDSHHKCVDFSNMVLLSVLPWFHAFGLTLELLPALLFQAEVFRDPAGGRDPEKLAGMVDSWDFTHLSGVPVMFERLLARIQNPEALKNLRGIVGGAPVNRDLAIKLRQTRLRAGYGQTQAGPGIMLGEPGEWEENFLGRPIGCQVRVASDGELEFRGPNICAGVWGTGGLTVKNSDSLYLPTGDIVEQRDDRYYFRARKDLLLKLPNGRWFHPEVLEAAINSVLDTRVTCVVLMHPANGRLVLLCADQDAVERLKHFRTEEGTDNQWPGWSYIESVQYLPANKFLYLPKGDINRRAMSAAL